MLSLLMGSVFLLRQVQSNPTHTVVFVAGDEEYRSEEMMPQLAAILSKRHKFQCKVLFSIAKDGTIDPTEVHNIPGLEILEKADLLVIMTRFRDLPDDQMRWIDRYVKSGKPIIGIRTATHAFQMSASSSYSAFDWRSQSWPGGFGKQVLGETWIAHHGSHMKQSTRAIPASKSPTSILNSVSKVWVPTDVYEVGDLPQDAHVVLYGQVLSGMSPTDEPLAGPINDPLVPVAWFRVTKSKQRVFTTTMGSAIDFECEDFRRLLVNACYWCLDLGVPRKADVRLVGHYGPSPIGFGKHVAGRRPPAEFGPGTSTNPDK